MNQWLILPLFEDGLFEPINAGNYKMFTRRGAVCEGLHHRTVCEETAPYLVTMTGIPRSSLR